MLPTTERPSDPTKRPEEFEAALNRYMAGYRQSLRARREGSKPLPLLQVLGLQWLASRLQRALQP